MARQLEEEGRLEEALTAYQGVIAVGESPSLSEAYFGVGRCEARRGRHWTAFSAIEKSFPKEFHADAVSRRVHLEFSLGKAVMALGDAPVADAVEGAKTLTGYEAGARIFAAIVYNDPQSLVAPRSRLLLGDCQLALRRTAEAATTFRRAIRACQGRPEALEAKAGLIRALAEHPYPDNVPPEVFTEIEELLRQCTIVPEMTPELKERVEKAQASRNELHAKEMLRKARFYLLGKTKAGRKAARFLLEDLLHRYPETASAGEAQTLLSKIGGAGTEGRSPE